MFQNMISLGYNCLTATAMSKYGLRSASGPFDWASAELIDGVVFFMEHDFQDYLKYENLRPEFSGVLFSDTVHSVLFGHEITTSLENDYKNIYQKHQRRIERFRKMTKEPTCFIRGCWHPEELSEYVEYESRITAAIQKNNAENELIIVVPKFIYEQNPVHCKFRLFIVDVEINGFDLVDRDSSRSFFDTNDELIDYLVSNYPENKRKDNLIRDLQKELTIAKKGFERDRTIRRLEYVVKSQQKQLNSLQACINQWNMIENKDFSTISYPAQCAIYGCEGVGRVLSQKIGSYTHIIEFLDKHPNQTHYHTIPVHFPEESKVRYTPDIPILIVQPDRFEEITSELQQIFGKDVNAVRLEEFLAGAKTIDHKFSMRLV